MQWNNPRLKEPDPRAGETISLDLAARIARDSFGLTEIRRLETISQGKVNQTFFIQSGPQKYILQQLHPIFGGDGAVVENWVQAATSLTRSGMPAPIVIPTTSGGLFAKEKGLWRLTTWLAGRTIETRSPDVISQAAGFLGRFHRALFKYPPSLQPLPPADYNREGPIAIDKWTELIDRYQTSSKMPALAEVLDESRNLAQELPVIEFNTLAFLHGDPKLDNFLWDDQIKVTGLIDLDTVRTGALLWELADGLRSWTSRRDREDQVSFSPELFLIAARSYRANGLPLPPREWELLPAALQAVALNLAWRYFQDYFEESYFVWDRRRYSSLSEQNRRRGHGMKQLVVDVGKEVEYLVYQLRQLI